MGSVGCDSPSELGRFHVADRGISRAFGGQPGPGARCRDRTHPAASRETLRVLSAPFRSLSGVFLPLVVHSDCFGNLMVD